MRRVTRIAGDFWGYRMTRHPASRKIPAGRIEVESFVLLLGWKSFVLLNPNLKRIKRRQLRRRQNRVLNP